ncbi:thiol:disulfide interchange protein DsbA/DsbL [Massilia forsythiae]|uniref:Thiol:disulfide interchange protein n=1 Tax=Massilia forsythiae TaxID=2728020 RepID=A0A7Z2VSU3_9BURK|nr:thiol:disulfide interchange protein DsbA/DsbL [Massilia forsythiae]QJD98815.1 thiol:disulfide interchange protein DsbA/DsbL [Massilia forsythiae]
MRFFDLAAAGMFLLASTAFASPANPQNGVDYVTLSQAQPVQTTGKKVEVIEFFMYHCPVCNAIEPMLEDWIRKQGDRIAVRRVHFPSTGPADPEAHLYLTLEALGKVDEMHAKVFKAVHVERIRLNKDDAIIDWVAKNGIDRATFVNAWNSFGVTTRLRQLGKVTASYGVDSAPALVVDGRYLTSPSTVNVGLKTNNRDELFRATLQVADGLVAKVAQAK